MICIIDATATITLSDYDVMRITSRLYLIVCGVVSCILFIIVTLTSHSTPAQTRPHKDISSLRALVNDYDLYDAADRHSRGVHQCIPFTFPRPTSDVYVSASANHGAGIGHQFGEWLYGPYLAFKHNITYSHTPFLYNGGHWTEWLGFGAFEDTEQDIVTGSDALLIHDWRPDDEYKRGSIGMDKWIHSKRDEQQQSHYFQTNRRKNAQQQPPRTISLTTTTDTPLTGNLPATIPIETSPLIDELTTDYLLRLYRIHVPDPKTVYACNPYLNLILRQKYCFARIKWPININLYREDRLHNRIIIAIHLRCGDSCFDPQRTTTFESIKNTINILNNILNILFPLQQLSFHIFTQPPQRIPGTPTEHHAPTAEEHFQPLLDSLKTNYNNNNNNKTFLIQTHYYISSHVTLHHLIESDILLGAQSSFSWISSLLHHITSFGPMPQCKWNIEYNKKSGEINQEQLINSIQNSWKFKPKFNTLQDCYDLKMLT